MHYQGIFLITIIPFVSNSSGKGEYQSQIPEFLPPGALGARQKLLSI
jgi:hypothetical protein